MSAASLLFRLLLFACSPCFSQCVWGPGAAHFVIGRQRGRQPCCWGRFSLQSVWLNFVHVCVSGYLSFNLCTGWWFWPEGLISFDYFVYSIFYVFIFKHLCDFSVARIKKYKGYWPLCTCSSVCVCNTVMSSVAGGTVLTHHPPNMLIPTLLIPSSLHLPVPFFALQYLSCPRCPPPLIQSRYRSSYPPSSHLRHVISLSISHLPFCSFRFHNISTPSFHFDILASLHLSWASMNTLPSPYLSLAYLDLPLSFSMYAYLRVSVLSQSQRARLS